MKISQMVPRNGGDAASRLLERPQAEELLGSGRTTLFGLNNL